ncbi:MAG: asparaginyl/glutamyl-tRNA amidotransferase subunit C [Lentisphaerae bacterium RIFOXYA12_FULL_48_11]|nr:MAG: asparaginyl/glutamyl-tRNA amidotransferase subunit C [Lentisphaerae bacterium RIFOXYA12_FULL_48_11]
MAALDKETTDKIDVAYVARLARLYLADTEVQTFQGQLDHIVGYMKKIDELDLSNVEPTSHAVTLQNVFREDVVKPGLAVEQVMANAPAQVSDQFQVPKIIE